MANDYFNKTGNPANHSSGSSALVRSEFSSIELAFDKLPALTGNALELVRVNSGASALESITPALARAETDKSLGMRNKLINGDFSVSERGITTQTASGYGVVDRWLISSVGSTKSATRQTFAVGQTDVPGNPEKYLRVVVTSVAGAANFTQFYQSIESVSTLSGQNARLTFWAKADAPKNICARLVQRFGSGGAPSTDVTSNVTTVALTTTWAKYSYTFSVPSISGKTLGSNGNDACIIAFWLEAGSNFNADSNSLGQQSGTFEFADIQFEPGEVDTPFERRHPSIERMMCRRYFIFHNGRLTGVSTGTSDAAGRFSIQFPVEMRATPTCTVDSGDNPSQPLNGNVGIISGVTYAATVSNITSKGIGSVLRTAGIAASALYLIGAYTADAELN